MYGSPAMDLAHASLPTSIFWATGDWDGLSADARRRFTERYLKAVPQALGNALRPWLAPMTRLTWLRTTTWAATWRVERLPALARAGGLEGLVAVADARTAALIADENVERQAGALPAWDAEGPA